ncbi:MAG TPA: CpsD/CapB family tyrosine-protein kinase [Blastocatellia bacterium]|nr:CpsD/CapB family tyrosine-protein kinase [Blastocatellia bacterium]
MGKVYDALKKAEAEGHPAVWSSVAVEEVLSRASTSNGKNNGTRKSDFIDYSLNALDAVELEERNREIAAANAARKSLVQPSREVTIDTSRIALPLTAFHSPTTLAAEEYNRLAVTLITAAGERPLKRVLIASAQHGEGRTSITLNFACALARAQRRVLVIDADLHRPSHLRFLGLSVDVGLSDALKKGLPAGSAVVRVQPFGFDLLPTREQVKNSAELLSSASFGEMLEQLEPDYDFILLDSPPLLAVADSSLLIRHTDVAVLVIRSGKTTSGQIGRAVAPLVPEKILGVVLNRAA